MASAVEAEAGPSRPGPVQSRARAGLPPFATTCHTATGRHGPAPGGSPTSRRTGRPPPAGQPLRSHPVRLHQSQTGTIRPAAPFRLALAHVVAPGVVAKCVKAVPSKRKISIGCASPIAGRWVKRYRRRPKNGRSSEMWSC